MRLLSLVFLLFAPLALLAAPPTVQLELITDPGLSIEAPQKWIAMMKDMGLTNVRIRSGQNGDKTGIRKSGTDDQPHYAVTGIITAANVLKLPGATIRLNDKTGLTNWIAKLQDSGDEGVRAKKVAYGLTAKEMVAVHDAVKGAVDFDTKGEPTSEVFAKIVKQLDIKVELEPSAVDAVKSNDPVADELHGMAGGTALAAVLRPLGMAYVPQRKLGEKLHLQVSDMKGVDKPWPVGWDSPESAGRLAPDYFKQTNAEITDYVLVDALAAIQKRIQLPMVFDYNNIARQRIDLEQKVSTKKKGKKSYAAVVDEILYQAHLSAEMRIDEAEKPFLWITTIRQK
jgi:hypothetical protein